MSQDWLTAFRTSRLVSSSLGRVRARVVSVRGQSRGRSDSSGSAEEHRDVAADVVEAGVARVDVVVVAEARQRHDEQDEAGLHDEPPGEGEGQG